MIPISECLTGDDEQCPEQVSLLFYVDRRKVINPTHKKKHNVFALLKIESGSDSQKKHNVFGLLKN